ncbi:MAG: DUF4446 family protein [Lachnospiraceae bacterium]|nr:DUF4446 family protein [Lachnospiraceae bacterium]
MNSEILANIGIDPGIIIIVMAGLILILLILLIVNLAKTSGLKKKYNKFMEGRDGASLEEIISNTYEKYDDLSRTVDANTTNIEKIIANLKITYQKMGLVKYDAFNEMGGKLSFSLALLDKENNGFIINSMHSREGCYTYVKEIVKGESYIVLAEEEREALDEALKQGI